MITITNPVPAFETFHEFLGYDPERCLFFDIETTGLSPSSSFVFLIGAVCRTDGQWQLTQYLAQSREDEPGILASFFQLAKNRDVLLHFNGTSFDLPYLAQRAETFHLENPLCEKVSLDLYQTFRSLKAFLGLPRMNQTTLESYLKWNRQDLLTGKHMISLFRKYTASGEQGLEDLLLLHNHDDLIGMTHILKMSAYCMLQNGRLKEVSARKTQHSAVFSFLLEAPLPEPLSFTVKGIYHISVYGNHGELSVSICTDELVYFFPDYRNYYYLPLEDQAIHKSVGAFVDRDHRIQAKPENCYIRKTGSFLPQPALIFEPCLRKSFSDKQQYFELTEPFSPESSKLLVYIREVLKQNPD